MLFRSPLPVWESEDGNERTVAGSVEELKSLTKKSENTYFTMRHGESTKNVEPRIVTGDFDAPYPLTEKGKEEVLKAAESLKGKVDLIFTSPVWRAKETTKLIAEALDLDTSKVITDDRLREFEHGSWEGRLLEDYEREFPVDVNMFERGPEGGENWTLVRKRVGEFLYEIESTHQNKRILIVSHGDPLGLLHAVAQGLSRKEAAEMWSANDPQKWVVQKIDFVPLPHNADYEIDLHRPFIDDVVLMSPSGKEMRRVPDVIDVWFDSGAMPFATESSYPADFISEAIDQTRGWFYTLMAIGVLMGKGAPYKNVISLGHLMDAEGKKMSKSRGNVINPWEAIDQWGVDTLRFWMYSVNDAGDSKNFDEKTVREASRALSWLENSATFYELFKDEAKRDEKKQVVDEWMLERLDKAVNEITA